MIKKINGIRSFWKLTEPGNFIDQLSPDQIADRSYQSQFASSPSFLLAPQAYYNFAQETPIVEISSDTFFLPETTNAQFYEKLSPYFNMDFTEITYRRITYTSINSPISAYAEINGKQTIPYGLIFSAYHGLVLPFNYEYYLSIHTKISENAISMYFLKTEALAQTLISGWSSTYGSIFNLNIRSDNQFEIEFLSNVPILIPVTVVLGNWHNIIFIWKFDTSSHIFYYTISIDGINKYDNNQAYASAEPVYNDIEDLLIIGGKLSSDNHIDPSSRFSKYIREISLFKIYVSWLSVTNAINKFGLAQISKISCNPFDHNCWTTFSPNYKPDGSEACPSECNSNYFTGCNLLGECIKWPDENCLSSNKQGFCICCQKNTVVSKTGKCVCDSDSALNSTSLTCDHCHDSCLTCSQPGNKQRCTKCPLGYALNPIYNSDNQIQGECIEKCPENSTENINGICENVCDDSCRKCYEGKNPYKCTSCKNGQYIVGENYGPCVKICPYGTAVSINETKCLPCHYTCDSCITPYIETACLACNGNYTYKSLINANKGIGTCTNNCSNLANFENNNTLIYTDTVNKLCYQNGQCPINMYKNIENHECQACHFSCFGCTAPQDPTQCLGCSSGKMFLRLESQKAPSGTCVYNCEDNDIKDTKILLCIGQPNADSKKQGETITDAVNSITTAFTVSSLLSSVLMTGNIGALAALLGPLQMMNLFSVINIPRMPIKLGTFYKGMGILSFEFLPNLITYFLPESFVKSESSENELTDNAQYNASIFPY